MLRFKVKKKGYDIAEVEEYIGSRDRLERESGGDKSFRVDELKSDIARLNNEISVYRKKEESVNQALITAIEKSNEMECQAKLRFALECERIKLFKGKWTSFVMRNLQQLGATDTIEKFNTSLSSLEGELSSMMKSVGGSSTMTNTTQSPIDAQYLDETRRLLDKIKSKEAKVNALADSFNLDDINNPPSLLELVKELGIAG